VNYQYTLAATNMVPSEHKRNTPLATLMVVMVFGLLLAVGVTGIVAALSMSFSGALKWWESALIVGFGSVIAGVFAFLLARFCRRILSVKTIRLCEGGTLEIITIRGKQFSARLPEDVKHVVVAEDGLSVTLNIAKRYFIVDSSEFTDGNRVKEFLNDFLKKSPVIGT
jgi:hypothetical protein